MREGSALSWLSAFFLGLVQGIAEFLPISSSGHLAILQNFFKLENIEESHLFFDVLLHLGTLISVCIVYRKDIMEMLRALVGLFQKKDVDGGRPVVQNDEKLRLALMIVIATLPLLVIVFIKDYIEQLTGRSGFIGLMLVLTGCLLFVSDKLAQGNKAERKMTVVDALVVGVSQAIATIPGLSRSGVTITAGLCTGFSREFAVRFSFLISIPAIIGANLISIVGAIKAGVAWGNMPQYLLGVVVAATVGYVAIRLVKILVDKNKFGKFAYYCWAVGLITILLSFFIK